MLQRQTTKVFPVHRVIGRYEVDGVITCIPAPAPGIEAELVELLIDAHVESVVKNQIVTDLLTE